MSVYEHIRQLGKKFFSCTHLPICSFDFNGNLIHSTGYTRELEEIFNHNHIFERARQEHNAKTGNSIISISCTSSIFFAASRICARNINRGFHILGPFTTLENANLPGIVYKPACCIPHLFTLLSNISADSIYLKQKIKNFNGLPYSPYVKKAIDYIDARYHEPITLSDIAAHLNISKYYLCSLFKKETAKTFSLYLNEIRIEKSKELLMREHLSILDIALSVGFNNQNYYNTIFKKIMKNTPLEFRNHRKSS